MEISRVVLLKVFMLKKKTWPIIALLLLAFFLRLILLPLPAFPIDINDWMAWAEHIARVGPGQFYLTIWSDYLPAYLYVLWGLAGLHHFLTRIPYEILLKIPAVFSDLVLGFLIFKLVRKEKSLRYALIVASLFLFNPLTFFLSSIWGQIDSFFALFLFLSVYLLTKKREAPAFIFLAISFLIKPQVILFLPLFFLYLRSLKSALFLAILFTITVFTLSFPFLPHNPIFGLPKLILKSASTYPYTSLFAMNFWGIFGTWKPDNAIFLNLSFQTWGLLLLGLGVILAWVSFLRSGRPLAIYLSSSLIILAYFMLPTRVHERWLYPFFPFFLIAATLINKRKTWAIYFLLSLTYFLNLYFVYTYYTVNFLKIEQIANFVGRYFNWFSLLAVLIYGWLLVLSFKKEGRSEKN